PWTLPANLAIVANPELSYVALPVKLRDGSDELLVVAEGLAESFLAACGLECPMDRWIRIPGAAFEKLLGTRYRHPLGIAPRSDAAFRLYFARHATLEAGTGLVHTAPGHGADDYVVGREVGLPIYAPVDDAGKLSDQLPANLREYVGVGVFDANPRIVARLHETGFLLNKPGESIRHQYPCCWRCKTPIVFRATAQWFARLGSADDPASLRSEALAEIGRTQWIPAWGENRIRGMIEAR